MNDVQTHLTDVFQLGTKITGRYTRRLRAARPAFVATTIESVRTAATAPWGGLPGAWQAWIDDATNCVQRSILLWDTIRERGNNFLAHERAGNPLPELLTKPSERQRVLEALDQAVAAVTPTPRQQEMRESIRHVLHARPRRGRQTARPSSPHDAAGVASTCHPPPSASRGGTEFRVEGLCSLQTTLTVISHRREAHATKFLTVPAPLPPAGSPGACSRPRVICPETAGHVACGTTQHQTTDRRTRDAQVEPRDECDVR